MKNVEIIEGLSADRLTLPDLIDRDEPLILKSVAADWPLVRKGIEGPAAVIDYLARFDAGRPVVAYVGPPEIEGRFFYNEELTGLNFEAKRVPFADFLSRIAENLDDPTAPSFYIGSTDLDLYLPGLSEENGLSSKLPPFDRHPPSVGIWIGNRTVASTHFDFSNNIACNMVGRRRFTLFPPDQIGNLYPGPLEPTPGGQVVSMVDLRNPDLDRFPRFGEALEAAHVAELEPGDLLIYPAMWWHNVEAFDPFNVMVNYWWNSVPRFVDTPMITLKHALLSLRARPEHERKAWRELFDFYVFGDPQNATAHLPDHALGPLVLDETKSRRLRAELLDKLNR
jgi:hypothetical protein